jgi:hypothetical protein
MAIYQQGILGAFSGKVGAVVGSSWKGIPGTNPNHLIENRFLTSSYN